MFSRNLPRQAANQPIAAKTINDIADAAEYASRLTSSDSIDIHSSSLGPILQDARPQPLFYAKTLGLISARSGTTLGSGDVDLGYNNQGVFASRKVPAIKAYSIFGSAISAGVIVFICRVEGQWTIIAGDCSGSP
jgi:hypothetical protein